MVRSMPGTSTKKPYVPKAGRQNPIKAAKKSNKTFCVSKHVNESVGKKILLYADTGYGKTTAASTAPGVVMLCPDGGLDEDFVNPITGEKPDVIGGIETFSDVRNILQDVSLFSDHETVVLDTLTYIQGMCGDWCVENIKKEKGGHATSLVNFPYGKGFEHVYNQMRLLQGDMDGLIQAGKNVICLCQLSGETKIHATHGEHFYAQPDLYDKKNSPVCGLFVAWASYVFKIDWEVAEVEGKVGCAGDEYAFFVKPQFSFKAKSRGTAFEDHDTCPFETKADDTVWRAMFDGKEYE